jgi:WD40 repeat protein
VKLGGLELDSYDKLKKGGSHGGDVIPGNSAESRLVQMLTGKVQPSMPMDGKRMDPSEVELIRTWIDRGAHDGKAEQGVAAKGEASASARPNAKQQVFSVAWRPDGSIVALGGFKEVRLIDPGKPDVPVASLSGHADAVRALAFTADGKRLAAAGGAPGRRGQVLIWDVDARKVVATISGHLDCVYGLAISPDGALIATSSYDKLIKLWDAGTGKEVRTLKDHIDAVYALAFTPDGKRLISGAADRSVKVWDPATGERLYTMSDPLDGINAIAVDPTGNRVAAGGLDKTIRIWTLGEKSGTLVHTLIAHEDAILQLAWSSDGKTLASSGADRTIKMFDADLNETKAIPGQPDWVMGLRFSPDGKLAAGRFDGSLTIYTR